MPDTLRKCLALLGRGHRGRWILVVALALVVAALEAAGALIVYALLQSIATGRSILDVPFLGDLRTLFPGVDEDLLVAGVCAVVGLFFVVRAVTIVGQSYVEYRVAENAGVRLASRLLAGYLALPYSFHLERNSSELIRNAYDTVQQFVREALLPAVSLIGHSLITLGLLGVLLYTSPVATLLAVVLLGPFTWMLLRVIHPRVKRLGWTAQKMAKTSLQTLEESLAGWRDIKILGRETFFVEQFEQDRRRLARARYLRSTAKALPRAALQTGLVLFLLVLLAVSEIRGEGSLDTLPVLALFGYVAVRLQPSISTILVALNSLKFVAPGIDLIYRDLELFREQAVDAEAREPLPLRRELRLDDVSVRYPGSARNALSDVTVTIEAGEFIGVVGSTGGGKTTLVNVLLGLIEPTKGRVTVDGVDLQGNAAAWHASLGVVHQMVFVADTTLRQNIALGVPEDEIDDAAVAEAVGLAQLDGFVRSLPEGLDTVVGERGVRISGGQRQRLAIARALYRRPSVIVLDEGTAALDNNTEAQFMAALAPMRGERTIIVVAHRLTTVAACDRVLLVERGQLIDVAPFEELASRHGELLLVDPPRAGG